MPTAPRSQLAPRPPLIAYNGAVAALPADDDDGAHVMDGEGDAEDVDVPYTMLHAQELPWQRAKHVVEVMRAHRRTPSGTADGVEAVLVDNDEAAAAVAAEATAEKAEGDGAETLPLLLYAYDRIHVADAPNVRTALDVFRAAVGGHVPTSFYNDAAAEHVDVPASIADAARLAQRDGDGVVLQKMLLITDGEEHQEELFDHLEAHADAAVADGADERLHIVKTECGSVVDGEEILQRFIEVLPPNCNKLSALELLCQHLGIPIEQTLAVGDGDNDIEMIRGAGWGVAMANAGPAVKEAADEVLEFTNEEDGVARMLERIFELETEL